MNIVNRAVEEIGLTFKMADVTLLMESIYGHLTLVNKGLR